MRERDRESVRPTCHPLLQHYMWKLTSCLPSHTCVIFLITVICIQNDTIIIFREHKVQHKHWMYFHLYFKFFFHCHVSIHLIYTLDETSNVILEVQDSIKTRNVCTYGRQKDQLFKKVILMFVLSNSLPLCPRNGSLVHATLM